MEIEVTNDNFEKDVLKSEKKVLIDFWATWCGPCRMISPIIEEIADENDGLIVGKVNVDDEVELAKKYGIMSIPTLMLFENGEEKGKIIGYHSKDEIEKFIQGEIDK